MVVCGYVLDVILSNVAFEGGETMPNFVARVTFGELQLALRNSSINVADFPEDRGQEFVTDTNTIKDNFGLDPMTVTLYDIDEVIGSTEVMVPDEVITQMEKMASIAFTENITIINPETEEIILSADLVVRLTSKCQNLKEEDMVPDFEEMKDEILADLGSEDLFFVLSPSKRLQSCDTELNYTKEVPTNQQTLDMSQIKDYNGQLVATPSVLNTCADPDCCGMRRAVLNRGGIDRTCGAAMMLRSGKKKGPKRACLLCQQTEKSSSEQSLVDIESSEKFVFGTTKPEKFCLNTPPPELMKEFSVHPRCCPVCQTNVDWMPSYAPCPKCGYKAVPRVDELPYSHDVKADEILREYYFREPSSDPINCRACVHKKDVSDDDDCDCECQKGQTCAHCRVRRACRPLFGAKFDLCDDKQNVPEPPLYSKPLQEVFCQLKNLIDQADLLKNFENKEKCSKMLYDHEEEMIKHKVFGDARYKPSKDLQAIKERMSQCKTITGEPCTSKKKKKIARRKCRFECGKLQEDPKILQKNVPGKLGWLWNLDPYTKKGWKPGAVPRPVRDIMAFFLADFPPDTYNKPKTCQSNKPPPPENPVLRVCKRDGITYVTIFPVGQCANGKPLQFKIEKTREVVALREIRDEILANGYEKCTCLSPIADCTCRSLEERERLDCYVMKVGCYYGIKDAECKLILNDEYDSEVEYDFDLTPPVYSNISKASKKRKQRRFVNNITQFNTKDLLIPKPKTAKELAPKC